jgi:hypothetical protein
MEIKKMRIEPAGKGQPNLFWGFDHSQDAKQKDQLLTRYSLAALEALKLNENIEVLPDPILHVIGVQFEQSDLETIDGSMSPSSFSKSRVRPDEEPEREVLTSRTITNGPLSQRQTSNEIQTLRERISGYSKEKPKNPLASITNKYTKPKGTYIFSPFCRDAVFLFFCSLLIIRLISERDSSEVEANPSKGRLHQHAAHHQRKHEQVQFEPLCGSKGLGAE